MELCCRGNGQVNCSFFSRDMGAREPTWSERIRDLIEEVDRVRHESERVRWHAEDSMKRERIWPDRRQAPRVPPLDDSHRHDRRAH
jgi:hypothetical protein